MGPLGREHLAGTKTRMWSRSDAKLPDKSVQSRQERLVVKTQARPSSKRGKDKAIKSRVEEVGSSRAMRYSNASASRNQRRPAEISVNAEKSVLCKKCQKMVRCQACRRAERACNAIGTGTEACSSRSSVSKGDDLSLSL
jgi:hypothetical protein